MEYRIGNTKQIKTIGETEKLICPKCNKSVKFTMFTNLDSKVIAKFPLLKFDNIHFAVCPNCSAVYKVNTYGGKKIKKDEIIAISSGELTELMPFDV